MPSSFCLNSSRNRYNDNDNDNDNTAAPDAGKSKTAPNKTGVQPERRRREQRTTNITPRSSNSNNSSRSSSANAMTSLLVAAAFVTASLGPTMDVVANAAAAPVAAADAANTPVLNLVSPGTLILEAPVLQKPQQLVAATESVVGKVLRTTYLNKTNRRELTHSVQTLQTTLNQELSSKEAWQQVYGLLKEYGAEVKLLNTESGRTTFVLRPPADYKRTLEDAITNKQVNILVNNELVQLTLEYQHNTNTNTNPSGGSQTEGASSSSSMIRPDDELILRVSGYKGYDPTAVASASSSKNDVTSQDLTKVLKRLILMDTASSRTTNRGGSGPQWYQAMTNFWDAPIARSSSSSSLLPSTKGDVIVVSGLAAITIAYAWSYAYYKEQQEQSEKPAKPKRPPVRPETTAANDKTNTNVKPAPAGKKKKVAGTKKTATRTEEQAQTLRRSKEPDKMVTTKKEKKKIEEKDESKTQRNSKYQTAQFIEAPSKARFVGKTKEQKHKLESELKLKLKLEEEATAAAASEKEQSAVLVDDDENDAEDINVVIEFDEKGKVIFKVDEQQQPQSSSQSRPDSVLAFVQALYFPWLGFFFSSSSVSSSSNENTTTPKVLSIVQSVYFPWGGIFFPASSATVSTTSKDRDEVDDDDEDTTSTTVTTEGVLLLFRALLFPWFGILQGK